MQSYYFNLSLAYDLCVALYQPGRNTVVITAEDGKRVQLPVQNLRPFIQRHGLRGRFRLIIDDQNKVKSFEKIY
ncbi:MAG: hypothetical protein ACI965_002208 [Paraglaciecola sp.]|jgi:hypothetical protein